LDLIVQFAKSGAPWSTAVRHCAPRSALRLASPTNGGRSFVNQSEPQTTADSSIPAFGVVVESENDWLPTDTIYTNCMTTIPGARDQHVMFPAIYHQADVTFSILFYPSYDRKVWHKASANPVFDTASFGQFDGGCILVYPNFTELANGDWIPPYNGFVYPHKYPRGAWSFDAPLWSGPRVVWPRSKRPSRASSGRCA
jgi:hypothetical protein